jgi:hypothetical protein
MYFLSHKKLSLSISSHVTRTNSACVAGHNLVSLGSTYVFIGIPCKPKPCLSDR